MKEKMISVLLAALCCCSGHAAFALEDSQKPSDHAYATVRLYDKDGASVISSTVSIQDMTDNDDTTHFQSARGVDHGEIVLDLYYQTAVNRIFIKEIATVIQSFTLQLSRDGDSWETVHTGSTIGGYGRTFSFSTQTARFVKLNILKTDNEFGDATLTLREFQAYDDTSLVTDDLDNALYLARLKAEFIQKEVVRDHYTQEDVSRLDSLIRKGERAQTATAQETIDQAVQELDGFLFELADKVEPGEADYLALYEKYFESLVGNGEEYDDARKETIAAIEQAVDQDWPLLLKNPTKQLFEEYIPQDGEGMVPVYQSLGRVKKMAIAYQQEHNKYYQNEELLEAVLNAVQFVIEVKYNNGLEEVGNWYEWKISVPRELADLMILLDKEMPEEMKETIHSEILYRTGGERYYEVWSGGNRTYLCNVYLKLAISTRNEKYFRGIIFSLQDQNVFVKTVEDEGFLYDGTFAAHIGYVYNTGYGLDLVNNSLTFIKILQGTVWQVDQSMIDDFAQFILLGLEPVLVNGVASDVMSGRNVGAGLYYGQTISKVIGSIGEISAEPYRSMFRAFAKECALQTGTDNEYASDSTIVERGPVTNFKRFVMGDKVVYHNDGWGFGLGMYSNRIRNFERVNEQAKKAWYSNSGALYLMNSDTSEYDNDWWTAVNHYHIPGTTTDMITRNTEKWNGEGYSPYSWVSSMDLDDTYGCAGFTNHNFFSTLRSLKSYFVFDDEIVCLGSGITGGTDSIETTVANQRMRDDNSNEISINGEKVTQQQLTDVEAETVYIEGNVAGDSYGYYFPGGQKLNYLNSYRSAEATDFNINYTPGIVSDYFTELWIDHGKSPSDDSYAYVILPNQTQEQLGNYAQNPDIEILQQDASAHIVRENKLGITGYNIWATTPNVTGDGIATSGPVIMMTRESDSQYEISLTDPTMEASEVTIEFPLAAASILECHENITVLETNPLKISVDLKEIEGRKLSMLVSKQECTFDASLLEHAIFYNAKSGKSLINNRVRSDFAPLIEGENIYLPLDAVAAAYGDRFHYSKTAGAWQLLTDEDVLTIQKDGFISLNGKNTVYAFRPDGASDIVIKDQKAYASLAVLGDVYHTKGEWDQENLIFMTDGSLPEETLEAVKKYVSGEEAG